ncbi:hypothetical protein BLS_000066 [Venturia inaequalis]|uniref:Uncharacterized protein n=1 Tax=Venturia inaequalis TaxID=5025 RepID=A0A8H3VDM1_VENIN|nr:hypothetical protein BLS_000066 [Venturia inaequalis]
MASAPLVQYGSDSEPSTPQPNETNADAESDTESRLYGDDEWSVEPVSSPLSRMPQRLGKRRHTVDGKGTDALEKRVPKRRKKSGDGVVVSGLVTDAEVAKQRIVLRNNITKEVVETEEMAVDEVGDGMDVDTEISEVARGMRVVTEDAEHMHGAVGEGEGKATEKGDDDMDSASLASGLKRQKKTSRIFFENLYRQRFGMVNLGRLPAAKETDDTDSVYASWRDETDDAGVKQTVKQQQLESFFQQKPNIRDAKRRLEFVKPYMDRTKKDVEKKWSSLSLVMRLNIIASLGAMEEEKQGNDKAWVSLRKDVKKIRELCEGAQYHMNQPENWEQYDGGKEDKVSTSERWPDGGPTDDQILGLFGSGDEEEDDTPVTHQQTKAKVVFDWQGFEFTPAQQTKFDTLCGQIPIADIAPDRKMTKGQWKAEEFRFLYEWMAFKGPGANWNLSSADVVEMGQAHKAFFTDFLFLDGKVRSLCRGAQAIRRHVRDFGGKLFEVWTAPVNEKAKGERAIVEDETAVGEEMMVDEGAAVEDDGNMAEELVEEMQEHTGPKVELNKGGFPAEGQKSKEDVKRYFERITGEKVPETSGDEYDQAQEGIDD